MNWTHDTFSSCAVGQLDTPANRQSPVQQGHHKILNPLVLIIKFFGNTLITVVFYSPINQPYYCERAL